MFVTAFLYFIFKDVLLKHRRMVSVNFVAAFLMQ